MRKLWLRPGLTLLFMLFALSGCGGKHGISNPQPAGPAAPSPLPGTPVSGLERVTMRPQPVMEFGGGEALTKQVAFTAPLAALGLSQLPAPTARQASFIPANLSKNGADYDPAKPNNKVTTAATSLDFMPTWSGAQHFPADIAYAIYDFQLDDYAASNQDQTIGMVWSAAAFTTDISNLWIGVSNWSANKWDWYAGPQDKVLSLGSFTPYTNGTGHCLVLIAMLGTDMSKLNTLQVGAPELRATGLDPDPAGSIEDRAPEFAESGSLPASVDLKYMCSPVGDQGSMGSCTAFASAKGCFDAVLGQTYRGCWDFYYALNRASTRYLYVKTGVNNCGSDKGRNLTTVLNYLNTNGDATQEYAPYGDTDNFDCSGSFSADADADALLLRASPAVTWSTTGDEGINKIKSALATMNVPVAIGIHLDDDFGDVDEDEVWDFDSSTVHSGGHAMCVVGYDDSKSAFHVRNSWGDDWCDDGYCWISYNSLKNGSCLISAGYIGCNFSKAAAARFCLKQPPAYPVSDLQATDGTLTDRIALSWSSNNGGGEAYDIYRDNQQNKIAAHITGTSYQDTAVGDTLQHVYWVKSLYGNFESEFSTAEAGYKAPDPYINVVTPTSGNSSSFYQPHAVVTGSGPFTYAWDFGGAAVPNTSTEVSPVVQLTNQGLYSASLTVTGTAGIDTYDFKIVVDFEESEWTHTWGRTLNDSLTGIASDSIGAVFATGSVNRQNEGGIDVLTVKYSRGGQILWERQWGGTSNNNDDLGQAVLPDGAGGVYVGGSTKSFGQGGLDAFVLHYDATGALLWNQTCGGAGTEGVKSLATAGGLLFAAGVTSTGANGGTDGLLLVYTPDGMLVGQQRSNGAGFDSWDSVQSDGATGLYLAGTTSGAGAGGTDLLLSKWDTTANVYWTRAFGKAGDQTDCHAVFDPVEQAYYVCSTGPNFVSDSDISLIKVLPDATLIWQRAYNTTTPEKKFARGVTLDPSGNVYVLGLNDDDVSFNYYHFLVKYDKDGNIPLDKNNKPWARKRADTATEKLLGLSCSAVGKLLIAGYANQADSPAWTLLTNGSQGSNAAWATVTLTPVAAGLVDASPSAAAGPNGNGVEDFGAGGQDALLINYNPLK